MGRLNRTPARTKVVVLDACRDNPFNWGRSAGRGFAPLEESPQGTYVVFSAQAGRIAQDGPGQPHSPFATALLEHIDTPGLELDLMVRRVREAVSTATNGRQLPLSENNLTGTFFFKGGQAPPPIQTVARSDDITVSINVEPVDAEVRVDSARQRMAFNQVQLTLPPDKAEITVEVTPKGEAGRRYQPHAQTYALSGKDKEIDITLVRRPKTLEDQTVPIVALAGGAVLVGGGVAFHVLAFEAADDAQKLLDRRDGSVTVADVREKDDERKTFMIAAGVAYGLAAVAVGYGLYALYETPTVAVLPTADGLAIGGTF